MMYPDNSYFERKKRAGLIFTQHNIDERKPYKALNKDETDIIREPDTGLSWWDRDNGRYRTEIEQKEYERKVLSDNQSKVKREAERTGMPVQIKF